MKIIRESPGIEKILTFVPEERNFDNIKKEIAVSLQKFEDEELESNEVSKRPLSKILRNFSKRFAPRQALKIETFDCFRYLLLISESGSFYVVMCIKLDLNHNPTLNIYQSLNRGKSFVFEEEKPIFKAFSYEYGFFFNPYELRLEVRPSESLNLPSGLKRSCKSLVRKVTSLVD
ncbi:MAG: hypothetical protein ACR2IQ_00665 [Minisyncoccia bacterium]